MSTLIEHAYTTATARMAVTELVRRLRQGELRLVANDSEPVQTQPAVEIYGRPSERELEVLRLVADGLVNTEIGRQLWLSPETVKSHVASLLAKLGAKTRAEAVAIGFRAGLLL